MKYRVHVPSSDLTVFEDIEADYLQYPLGILVFKQRKADPNSYPEIVKIYASGQWLTVTVVG